MQSTAEREQGRQTAVEVPEGDRQVHPVLQEVRRADQAAVGAAAEVPEQVHRQTIQVRVKEKRIKSRRHSPAHRHLMKRRVNQGELIGSMSDNGAEGQVHLHFEIRDASKPLSPIDLLP